MRAGSLRIVRNAVFYSAATLAAIYFGTGLIVGWLLVRPGKRRDYDCIPSVRLGVDGIWMGAAAAAYGVGHGEIDPDWMILESCYDNIRNAFTNRMSMRVGDSLTPLLAWPV